jgi:hypothetical protein
VYFGPGGDGAQGTQYNDNPQLVAQMQLLANQWLDVDDRRLRRLSSPFPFGCAEYIYIIEHKEWHTPKRDYFTIKCGEE